MADRSDHSDAGAPRGREPVRGVVWVGLVALLAAGALVSAWWFDRPESGASGPPGQPEAFCNAVGRLQQDGRSNSVIGDDPDTLAAVRTELAGLATAEPPAQIQADLGKLVDALDATIADARAAGVGDAPAGGSPSAALQRRLRDLEAESDRVNAYTERWCGAPLNQPPGPG